MEFPIKESIGAVVALTVAGLGYLQWRRTKRSGRYIEDREAAYKAVWQALEEIHLYVRTGDFDAPTFDELMKKANTLLIQQGLYISDEDKDRAGGYIAALRELGLVLGQMEASAPARHEMALTAEDAAVPPEFRRVYEAYRSARSVAMERFRRAIGAGQI
jgi:hypothetical protein